MIGDSDDKPKFIRIWRGRTRKEDFEAYSRYLHEAGVRKIESIPGNIKVEMFRALRGDQAEFMVVSYWPSLEAIRAFSGEDVTRTRHLEKDPDFLLELPTFVELFEVY
ncbi:antibiotic biosynthesis monooxygenase family protein [Labrys okinawensis]|uniref:antibiotic biosynthesis monooxygenase family protein n=1 Tax=Labrys okinawensis TaxID=346911 RepID=UPI0039BD2575